MAEIIKIAISGGPCSGKTTCIERLKSHYEQKGIDVFVCPESATEVINSGASRENMLSFETVVAKNQIKNESDIELLAAKSNAEKVLVIFDRGVTDCFGYVENEKALEDDIEINRIASWSRYDAVMIMQGAEDYKSDSVRTESEEMANEYAKSILSAWLGHPHLRYIKTYKNIDDKFFELCGEIDCLLNDVELEKKYLIAMPDMSSLSKYNPVMADIEQVYLLSDVGSHRIRKRVVNGVTTCFETLKIRITETLCTEIENIIDATAYEKLMALADPKKCTIVKKRYCFLYEGQYFELDVFPFWSDKAFLELELIDENQVIALPPEIELIKDVSNDSSYKNNNLAKQLYKELKANENS